MKVTILGIDLAKSMFRLHGVDARGAVTLRRQLTRKQLLPFLARLERCLVKAQARVLIEAWRRDYNESYPHMLSATSRPWNMLRGQGLGTTLQG
jgi:transposase